MKHKSPDYKTSVVRYYLNNKESMDKVLLLGTGNNDNK
jgi:hypothetical protein